MSTSQPFRHKLLTARTKDAGGFGKVFIPMMEGELIDSARSKFYLEQLEQLFRQEAYNIHLQKMVNKQQEAQEEGKEADMKDFIEEDLGTRTRRERIKEMIKERQ